MWECCFFYVILSNNFSVLRERERFFESIRFNKCFVRKAMFLCFIFNHFCVTHRSYSPYMIIRLEKRTDDITSRDDDVK